MGVTHYPPQKRAEGASTSGHTQAGRILVVDDDSAIRSLLQAYLPRQGFTVWSADNGRAALTFCEGHRDDIDLVLLDVCMPDLDGPETLRELRRLNPDVKCCFMSGHTGLYDADTLLKMGALRFFSKPFDLDDLRHSLQLLAGPARVRQAV
jgi:DNA-binding NtrC family response regulator